MLGIKTLLIRVKDAGHQDTSDQGEELGWFESWHSLEFWLPASKNSEYHRVKNQGGECGCHQSTFGRFQLKLEWVTLAPRLHNAGDVVENRNSGVGQSREEIQAGS